MIGQIQEMLATCPGWISAKAYEIWGISGDKAISRNEIARSGSHAPAWEQVQMLQRPEFAIIRENLTSWAETATVFTSQPPRISSPARY